jgi:predicted dehydrogenase
MSYKAPKDDSNRYFNPELGGGSLLDLGVYPVFLANLVLGRPPVIKAAGKLSDKEIDETCAAVFWYPAGQYALIESSLITQTDRTAEIYGDKGVLRILAPWNETPAGIDISIYNGDTTHIPCNWEGRGFQFEVAELADCLKNGRISSPLMEHQLSLDIMKTMDKIKDQLHIKYEADE